jgi:hypothetical protein
MITSSLKRMVFAAGLFALGGMDDAVALKAA